MDSPGLDDSRLLRRARVDANAFGVFYRRHARAVYRSLLCDCRDPDVALDLTAETFARALQSIGRFRGLRVASGRAWIFAIANSLLLQYERERRTEDRARRRLGILEATRTHHDDDSVVARVDAEASRGRLADVLGGLPESQQSVLRLRIEDEASYEEIAARLGCSPAAARQQASRGMRTLSEQFQAVGE
jgi:RNA polymerase sigma-70 factor (ECF subfamily)